MADKFQFDVEPVRKRKAKATKTVKSKKIEKTAKKVDKAVKNLAKISESYPVATTAPAKRRISKLDDDIRRSSILGASAETIQDYLENDDKDKATALLYKRMLQTLVDTVPHAENAVRSTKGYRGVYQLNVLISSIRELLADIQSSQDRGRLGETLIERLMIPMFKDLGTHVVMAFEVISSDAKGAMAKEDYIRFKKSLEQTRSNLGLLMNQQYAEVKNEVRKFFEQ